MCTEVLTYTLRSHSVLRMVRKCWITYSWWTILVLFTSWDRPVSAVQTVGDLYQATVSVTGQGIEERAAAFRTALGEVFARVAGRTVSVLPRQRVEDLVLRYRYESMATGYRLVIDFEPAGVDHLINRRGVSPWSGSRPSTLVWLLVTGEDGVAQLANSDGPSPYQAPLQEEANRRAIPLVWPMLDWLETSLSLAKGQGALIETLRQASAGYAVEAFWIGVLTKTQGNAPWTVRWTLVRGKRLERWNTVGALPEAALTMGVDQLAEHLRIGTPVSSSVPIVPKQTTHLVVTGVVSLADYAELRARLEALPSVARMVPTQLDPVGRIAFYVESSAGTALSADLPRVDRLLPEKTAQDSEDTTQYYHWSPLPKDKKQ